MLRVATLPCRTSMSENKRHSQTNVAINDKSQDYTVEMWWNLLLSPSVKRPFKSVNIWQNCRQEGGLHITISGTKYFHKVVWQHMQGTVGSLVNTIADFLENLPVIFLNRLRLTELLPWAWCLPFYWTRWRCLVLFANFLSRFKSTLFVLVYSSQVSKS